MTVSPHTTYTVPYGEANVDDTELGGTTIVHSGGFASPTTVSVVVDKSGVSANGPSLYLASSDVEITSAGGADRGAQISGGERDVYGLASPATVNGLIRISSHGEFGLEEVFNGGTAIGTMIESGDVQSAEPEIFGNLRASADGGAEDSSGGLADRTTIFNGGTQIVSTELGAQISSGEQVVFGYANVATAFAGLQVVELGGTARARHRGRCRRFRHRNRFANLSGRSQDPSIN
jgi:autotransporter passenger strand-loop-strand repeat protein